MSLMTREDIRFEIHDIIAELRIVKRRLEELLPLVKSNVRKNDLRSIITYIEWAIEGLEERIR